MKMTHAEDATTREKLTAVGILLAELMLQLLAIVFFLSIIIILLNVLGLIFAHLLGYSWAWVKEHFDELLLFGVIMATPILLVGWIVWTTMRDGYKRNLRQRKRKFR